MLVENTSASELFSIRGDGLATFAGQISSGRITITDSAVPFFFVESGNTGTGKYWRQVLDAGDIRFDVDTTSTNGDGTFASYIAAIQLNADGHTDIVNALDVGGLATFSGHISLPDSIKAIFGDSNDLQIYHDGSNSYIQNETGNLTIFNKADDADIIFASDNGSGGTATYFKLDGSLVNATTTLGATSFPDKSKIFMGEDADLAIYHDGANSFVEDRGTGDLRLKGDYVKIIAANNETMLSATQNGAVELYHNNTKTFETTSTGATVTGDLIVSANLTVNGTTTTLNTQTVEVEDNILQLNTTQGSPDTATATTSGISVYRGDGVTQASFIFDESDDTWDLTNNLAVAGNLNVGNTKYLRF